MGLDKRGLLSQSGYRQRDYSKWAINSLSS